MYAVVGCNACDALWLLADPADAETATCPRCGRTHRTDRLRHLFESEARATAREARATMLARRQGAGEAFDAVRETDLEREADDAGVDDREYLERRGVDPTAAAAAGDRPRGSGSGDRASVVRAAVETLDGPTEADVVGYATDRGVPEAAAHDLLERLVRRGEVVEAGDGYRSV